MPRIHNILNEQRFSRRKGSKCLPYKGGAPAINDLLGGQIPMSFNNGPESVGQLQAGTRARARGHHRLDRAPFLPDVPSHVRGRAGLWHRVWWGLLGPGGMPPDLVAKLSHDFVAALNTGRGEGAPWQNSVRCRSAVRRKQFDAKIHADYEKWGPIIKAAGMKAE